MCSDCSGDTTGVVRFRCNLERYYTFSNSSVSETRRRIALARQKAVVLASIWKNRNIKTATKVKVMKSMVWVVFQYGVEGWTLKKSDKNRIEAFEMWCWRKMLSISWQEHRTNDSILTELGLERELIGRVAKLKLQYFWPHHSGKCRTVGTYSPRRNHGRVTASRQTEKTTDTRH